MKIDKDFVLKYGERTFKANEIETIKISSGWFSMECIEADGLRVHLETRLENVEFLNSVRESDEEIVEITYRNMSGEEVRKETVPSWEGYERCGDCGFYGPPFGNHRDDAEHITPFKNTSEEFRKTVVEALGKLGEATRKLNDAMKVELSIDGKQFAKLMKKYNQDQGRRSGGD